jgi:hypothetical protein
MVRPTPVPAEVEAAIAGLRTACDKWPRVSADTLTDAQARPNYANAYCEAAPDISYSFSEAGYIGIAYGVALAIFGYVILHMTMALLNGAVAVVRHVWNNRQEKHDAA